MAGGDVMDQTDLLTRDRAGERGVETYVYDHAARDFILSLTYTVYAHYNGGLVGIGVVVRTRGGDEYNVNATLSAERLARLQVVMDRYQVNVTPPS